MTTGLSINRRCTVRRWFLVAWIGLLLTSLGCQPVPVSAQAPPEEKVDLQRQIQLLNLINGLELTPEQMRFILEKAVAVRATREALKAEAEAAEFEAILQEIRDALMAGLHVSGELGDAFFAAQGANRQLVEGYRKEVLSLAKEIEEVLESHQVYALEQYAPCIIPPVGEPRIGQTRDGKAVALLERLRAVPADRFELHQQGIACRIMKELERRFRGRLLIPHREAELDRILALVEEARSLSDIAFEVQKESLIEELLAPYEAAWSSGRRPQADVTAVIGRHLLDPAIIPLLEQRLELIEEWGP
jgi:hypothetical protein